MKIVKPNCLPVWRIRCNKSEFLKQWTISPCACIFFDDASKGDLRLSGAGGLIISPDRLTVTSFSWGLGKMSNNQAESYSLLKACQLAKEAGFKYIHVYEDSEILIKMLNSDGLFNIPSLNVILKRI